VLDLIEALTHVDLVNVRFEMLESVQSAEHDRTLDCFRLAERESTKCFCGAGTGI
jgi:hypothetical protein